MTGSNPFTTTAMIVGTLLLGGSGITIPTLWSRAENARADLMEATIQLENTRAELDRIKPELATSQQQVAVLSRQVDSHRGDAAAQRQSAAILSSRIGRLQSERQTLASQARRSDDLEKQVANLETQINSLTAEKANLVADLKAKELVTDKAAASREKSVITPKASKVGRPNTASNTPPRTLQPVSPRNNQDLVAAKPAPPTRELYDDTGWQSVSRVVTARPQTTTPSAGQVIIHETPVVPVDSSVIIPITPY